ncbi:MAG: NifB/NifX family molybdenum-iron cluster-binding protein [Thermodesulfobacteriota bacterium]
MKIAVSSTGNHLDSLIDPRFGRCAYFAFVESDDMSHEVCENPGMSQGGGAGIQSAQFVASKGARVVITGNCGPNAVTALTAAGIGLILGQVETVRQAVEDYKSGRLKLSTEPNVPDHYGTAGSQRGAGMGQGRGTGRGRGMGRGMGMGRSMGGRFTANVTRSASADAGPADPTPGRDEIESLKGQASHLAEQLEAIQKKITALEKD